MRLKQTALLAVLLLYGCAHREPPAPKVSKAKLNAERDLLELAIKLPVASPIKPLTLKQRLASRQRLCELTSPDGQWLLLPQGLEFTVLPKDRAYSIHRRLSDKQFLAPCSNALWMPDSRQWVCLMWAEKSICVVVLSRQQKGIAQKLPIGFPRGTQSWPDLMGSKLLGFIKPRRILALPERDEWPTNGKPRKVPFYAFSVGSDGPALREFFIALPKEAKEPREVALSPTGDQLAWLLYLAPSDEAKVNKAELAISRPNGSGLRVIGSMKVSDDGDFSDLPKDIAWLPDAKRVSFIYKTARWIAPTK